jgi:hypothetical protein
MKKSLRKRPAEVSAPTCTGPPWPRTPHGSQPSLSDNHLLPHSASIRVANGLILTEGFRPLHAHVLIEGTGPGDLNFVVRWLLSAAKADRLLAREFTNDPQFEFRSIDWRCPLLWNFDLLPWRFFECFSKT